jgi:hypothetical protein
MESIGISLGWNCYSAMRGRDLGIRGVKNNGYKTCPFDECITNYAGIVQCIRDDFVDFFSDQFLCLRKNDRCDKYCINDTLIHNTKYKFVFNHESPGHGNLWATQMWSGGINHFVDNNFENFKKRYKARIENFRRYLRSGSHITFLITHVPHDFNELREALAHQYPTLRYEILRFDYQVDQEQYDDHFAIMNID